MTVHINTFLRGSSNTRTGKLRSGHWIDRSRIPTCTSSRSKAISLRHRGLQTCSGTTFLLAIFLVASLAPPLFAADGDAVDYLATVQDQFHQRLDVYRDADAAGNHFVARGRFSSDGDEDAVPAMDESSIDNPHAGLTCIRARFLAKGDNWGGWYMMNGILAGSDVRTGVRFPMRKLIFPALVNSRFGLAAKPEVRSWSSLPSVLGGILRLGSKKCHFLGHRGESRPGP